MKTETTMDQEGSSKETASNIVAVLGDSDTRETIYFAGGCFWGVEEYFSRIEGVTDAVSGYANGTTENPTYQDVIYKGTGHAETVRVEYDESVISLEQLIGYYLKIIDPTSVNKQGNDREPNTAQVSIIPERRIRPPSKHCWPWNRETIRNLWWLKWNLLMDSMMQRSIIRII